MTADEVTADPVSDRQNWALQALGAATMVFDDRETNVGATASVDVAAGTDLGLFLIPNDTLDAVLDNPCPRFMAVIARIRCFRSRMQIPAVLIS